MKQFTKHTIETAPEASKEILAKTKEQNGVISNLFKYMAGSPAALEGYSDLSKTFFAKTSFTPGEQNLILLASSVVNQCQYCIAAHTRGAKQNGIPSKNINEIRKQLPVTDKKLNALVTFTEKITVNRGHLEASDLDAFYNAGFSPEQVMDIIVGVSLKTMSNYINHVTENIISEDMEPFAMGEEIED
jgi:uncharacterized peroxidase-related enzyme